MTPELWQRVKAIFATGLGLPPAERAAFLESACQGDRTLRAEVESLLAAHEAQGAFLRTRTLGGNPPEARSGGFRVGQEVGPYEIQSFLGAGGMATVHVAHDRKHDRRVALKVLHPDLAAALGTERFEREIKIAARLQHPHIVSVHDSGEMDGQLWFTMPFVEGESLRERLKREKQLPVDEALRLTREVAEALDYAHRQGVIHRDIKPENILLAEGHALVADFGIARALGEGDQQLTGTGVAIGTPAYMSPEQANGSRDIDARSDVYALGCVLFEMLAGEAPYTGPTPQAILARSLTETPRRIHPVRAGVSEALDAVIATAMAATPADRFASAGELKRALEPARVSGTLAQRSRWSSVVARRPVFAALTLGVLLGVGALFAWRRAATRPDRVDPSAPIDPRHVVAVLPFRDLSGDSSQAYLAAGITEEISAQVSRIAALRVMSRGATTPLLAAPDRLRRLASELRVGSVVEGTTRLVGRHLRIGVSLTDTRTGETLWSDQYDRDMKDVLAVEGEVAHQIATALKTQLRPAEAEEIERGGSRDPEAYQLYLRSRELAFTSPVQDRAGRELLQKAIRKDSGFASAWADLARRYYFLGGTSNLDSGLAAANRAVTLDPQLADAHYARGVLLFAVGQIGQSRLAFLRALELNPSHWRAMMDLSLLDAYAGRYDESLYWALRAVPLSPNSPFPYYHVVNPLIMLGDDEATARYVVSALRRFPGFHRLEMNLAHVEFLRGQGSRAIERARRLVAANPEEGEPPLILVNLLMLTRAADAEAMVRWMYRENPEGQGWIMWQSYRSLYAFFLNQRGQQDSARRLWDESLAAAERSISGGNDSFSPRLEIAAIYAVYGDSAQALDWLDRAFQAGWRETRSIARDPFFDGLRGNSGFRAIVSRAQSDVDAMLRRAKQTHPALFRR